jgi:hypothetical protein
MAVPLPVDHSGAPIELNEPLDLQIYKDADSLVIGWV